MPRWIMKTKGWIPVWALEPPYFLKHAPGNPYLGSQHNGLNPNYGMGFEFKKIHWLQRFRWNTQAYGITPFYLRNPGGKTPHWLEITAWGKFAPHVFSHEGIPHTILATAISALVIWNLLRYLFFHPDLTIYNVAFYTLRPYTQVLRNNEIMTLDQPVFRWLQQPPEFYYYNPQRGLYQLGLCANDPYVEFVKSIGREKELELTMDKIGPGVGAPGKITQYLIPECDKRRGESWTDPTKPHKHWYAGSDLKGPTKHPGDPGYHGHQAHHGGDHH